MPYTECVLSGILGSREEEMVTCKRKLHVEKIDSVISSPHIFTLINSWSEFDSETENLKNVRSENLKKKAQFLALDAGWILEKYTICPIK